MDNFESLIKFEKKHYIFFKNNDIDIYFTKYLVICFWRKQMKRSINYYR